jgi:hypothetical protein
MPKTHFVLILVITHNGCFFKFGVEVGVEEAIVNARHWLRIMDQLFLHGWGALNRLSYARFKKHPLLVACTYIHVRK